MCVKQMDLKNVSYNGGAQRLAPAGVSFCTIISKKHDSQQVRCSDLLAGN
jgi:hypothetical protein